MHAPMSPVVCKSIMDMPSVVMANVLSGMGSWCDRAVARLLSKCTLHRPGTVKR